MCVSLGGSGFRTAGLLWGSTGLNFRFPIFLTVSAAPGFHLEKARYRIAFHLFADSSLIYVPPKKKDALSLKPPLLCLEDIKDRVSLNFLKSNEKKTEAMEFGFVKAPLDLGRLAHYLKPIVSVLGFKVDSDFKLDEQIV